MTLALRQVIQKVIVNVDVIEVQLSDELAGTTPAGRLLLPVAALSEMEKAVEKKMRAKLKIG